ncbi:MAG TPA: tetratricopeptide repeat protein [Phycisphaerae bacterium]|nr:tetratricopeptide repeat protein [Phycisphaerae bacterium]
MIRMGGGAVMAAWLAMGAGGCGLFTWMRGSPGGVGGEGGRSAAVDLYLKGQLEAERGELDQAVAALSKAIEKNPDMTLALEARGDVYKRKGDYEKAASDFERETVLEPHNFNAHYELALMYQYLKRFTDAVAAYQKAVEIKPLDRDANMNLAVVYTEMGQPLRGIPYAQRATEGGGDAESYANLGVIYTSAGYTDLAMNAFKKSIEMNSRQPEVYTNLAQLYMQAGLYELARSTLEAARDLAPSPVVSERLGLAYYKLKEYGPARTAFAAALREDPNNVPALNGLGVVAMTESLAANPPDLDAAREALGYWDRSLKLKPDQPAIRQLVNKYTGKP